MVPHDQASGKWLIESIEKFSAKFTLPIPTNLHRFFICEGYGNPLLYDPDAAINTPNSWH
jgi:hypothetical protein